MDLATPYDKLRDWIDRIAAVGDHQGDDEDLRVRKHALAITVLGLIPAALLWAAIGLIIGRGLLTAASIYFALAMPLTLYALSRTKAFMPMVRVLLTVGLTYVVLGHLALGGMTGGGASLIWGLVAPVSAVLYFDRTSSLHWFGIFAALVVAALALDPLVVEFLPPSWSEAPSWLFAYNVLGPSLITLLLIRYVDGQRLRAQLETRHLLHEMLPGGIAERLADGERMIAEKHESVSVLFADVVGFTRMAGNMTADDLLLVLNQLFSAFDRVVSRHGLEKIKTTGDAYIAVAGAPRPMEQHAAAAVAAAVEMQHAVSLLGGLRRRDLRVRIGIASGAITAGVIGEHRYTYDMWGDTVNMASRMESQGIPGNIQVAESTRRLLGDALPWVERRLEVKGKGELRTFLLNPTAVRPVTLLQPDPAPATVADPGVSMQVPTAAEPAAPAFQATAESAANAAAGSASIRAAS
ncbi:MAG TPA: adenylate/guanylate cyclase domain-containing protein [Candidatus Limnocylindria bacterium]|jgi:guanylate cyclase